MNKKCDITADARDIKRKIKEYYEQHYAYRLKNLNEMGKKNPWKTKPTTVYLRRYK